MRPRNACLPPSGSPKPNVAGQARSRAGSVAPLPGLRPGSRRAPDRRELVYRITLPPRDCRLSALDPCLSPTFDRYCQRVKKGYPAYGCAPRPAARSVCSADGSVVMDVLWERPHSPGAPTQPPRRPGVLLRKRGIQPGKGRATPSTPWPPEVWGWQRFMRVRRRVVRVRSTGVANIAGACAQCNRRATWWVAGRTSSPSMTV